jgi:hypothetical protein
MVSGLAGEVPRGRISYDGLEMRGTERLDARALVREKTNGVLAK